MIRRIYPTRFGQMHLRSNEGKGMPLVLLHMSPRSGAMWEVLQERLERPNPMHPWLLEPRQEHQEWPRPMRLSL